MQFQVVSPVFSLGWLIAALVFVVVVVLLVLSQVPLLLGLLIGGVALSRLL